MTKNEKSTLILAIGGFFVLVLAAAVGAFFIFPIEPSQLDDGDILPQRPTVAADQNGFSILKNAGLQLSWQQEDNTEVQKIIKGETSNPEFVRKLLSDNQRALELFDQGLQSRQLQVPEIRSFVDERPYLLHWKNLASLTCLEALEQFFQGKEEAGLNRAIQVIDFGSRLQDAGGELVTYLFGLAIKEIGVRTVRQMVGKEKSLSNAMLIETAGRLESYKANKSGLTNALKNEYVLGKGAIKDLRKGRLPTSEDTKERIVLLVACKFRLDLKATYDRFGNGVRTGLDCIPQNLATMPLNEFTNKPDVKNLLKHPNGVGEILYGMLFPAWAKVFARKCQENVSVSATQTLIALRCFQKEHGSVPRELKELVPHFLKTVPVDDFDGQPLRYLPEKKLFYAVGKDLHDDGGDRDADVVFEFSF